MPWAPCSKIITSLLISNNCFVLPPFHRFGRLVALLRGHEPNIERQYRLYTAGRLESIELHRFCAGAYKIVIVVPELRLHRQEVISTDSRHQLSRCTAISIRQVLLGRVHVNALVLGLIFIRGKRFRAITFA